MMSSPFPACETTEPVPLPDVPAASAIRSLPLPPSASVYVRSQHQIVAGPAINLVFDHVKSKSPSNGAGALSPNLIGI